MDYAEKSVGLTDGTDAVIGCDRLQDTKGDLHNPEDRDNL